MKLIVDASVAVKWWFTERNTAESQQLLSHRFVLYAPGLLLTEAANVIWKKARSKDTADPQPYLEELTCLSSVVVLCPSTDLVAHALDVGLAIHHQCVMGQSARALLCGSYAKANSPRGIHIGAALGEVLARVSGESQRESTRLGLDKVR